MILTDNENAYKWFKKARYIGRNEIDLLKDNFDFIGWNFYMLPELAINGLRQLSVLPKNLPDVEGEYPNLNQFPIYANS